MLASSSPERFVGRDVLLRLCVPRYPPLALCSLTTLVFLDTSLGFFSFHSGQLAKAVLFSYCYAVFKVLTGLHIQQSYLLEGKYRC